MPGEECCGAECVAKFVGDGGSAMRYGSHRDNPIDHFEPVNGVGTSRGTQVELRILPYFQIGLPLPGSPNRDHFSVTA
jgi:hypothetical protein